MAIMMITAATPMMMPSMVRKERTLFLRIASQAMRMASDGFMLCLPGVVMPVVNHGFHQAVHQVDGALGVGGDGRVVRDHDDRGAAGVKLVQQAHDLLPG